MSHHDEQVAAAYLRSRRYPPTTRTRRSTMLFTGVVFIVVSILLAMLAFSDVIEIEQHGTMDDWVNIEAYGLTAPVPFQWRLWIDADTPDLDADNPLFGVYRGTRFDIDFGGWHVSIPDAIVQVWSGQSDLWGFRFSGWGEHTQDGFTYPGVENFSFTLQPFTSAVAPTDELRWVMETQNHPIHAANNHQYLNAYQDNTYWVHGEADENISVYTARVIPEPEPWGLAVLGAAIASRRRRT